MILQKPSEDIDSDGSFMATPTSEKTREWLCKSEAWVAETQLDTIDPRRAPPPTAKEPMVMARLYPGTDETHDPAGKGDFPRLQQESQKGAAVESKGGNVAERAVGILKGEDDLVPYEVRKQGSKEDVGKGKELKTRKCARKKKVGQRVGVGRWQWVAEEVTGGQGYFK